MSFDGLGMMDAFDGISGPHAEPVEAHETPIQPDPACAEKGSALIGR
jgi:hypothetical protein